MGADLKKDEKGNTVPGVYELGKMWIGEEYDTGKQEKDSDGNNVFDGNGNPVMVMAYRYHEDLIREKFLKPAPVCWANPYHKRSVLSLACGELFMLVVARDGGFDTNVYSAGHNGYGQLGHGDEKERHELTSVSN
jgi:alpha-tubulin suppressor-like RCC1 family protein